MDTEGNAIADNFYCLSSKQDEYYWEKTNWVHTPAKSYGDFKNLSTLETITLDMETSKAETDNHVIYAISIENPSQTIGFFVNLKMKDNKGEMIVPAFWSENYISLLPGQKKTMECKIRKDIVDGKNLKIEVKGWNSPLSEINL